jgi:hypothetical protein
MKEALSFSETSVLRRATWHNTPEDAILYSHRRENVKSYISVFGRMETVYALERVATAIDNEDSYTALTYERLPAGVAATVMTQKMRSTGP